MQQMFLSMNEELIGQIVSKSYEKLKRKEVKIDLTEEDFESVRVQIMS